jgi:adenylate kinase family enzyme
MSDKKPLNFVFFGIAGSGKGTQVEMLQKYLKEKGIGDDVVYAYPGNEFRKMSENNPYTGEIIKNIIGNGSLVPNFITDSVFLNILTSSLKENSTLIVDGYPRSLEQSITLEKAMKFYQRENVCFIYIEVSRDEAMKRMKIRSRSDDTDEGIAKRFDEYVNNVYPAMNYFEGKSGYFINKINGEQSIEEVHAEIISALGI